MVISAQLSRVMFLLLLVTGVWSPGLANGADKRPQIVIRFEVVSATINDALPNLPPAKVQAEHALAIYLAERMRIHFPFVAWTTGENPTAPVLGYLIARLVEDRPEPMPSISVHWFAIRSPSNALVETLVPPVLVYKKNDPTVATDKQGLQRDVEKALDLALVALSDIGFTRQFFNNFVSTIALASQVTALPAKRVIELPMRGDEIPIGQESEMKLEFVKSDPGETRKGLIKLSRFATTESGNLGGGVDKVLVNSANLTLADNWNPLLPELLNGTAVQCFLTSYKPDSTIPRVVTVPQ
jgi:hypothetical protein